MHLILWFIVGAICSLMYYQMRYPFVKKLYKLPGPIGGSIFGFIFIWLSTPRHKIVPVGSEITKQYGPIWHTWVGPVAFVLVGDAEGAKTVLSVSASINKSSIYTFLEPWLGSGLITSSGNLWHYRRQILTPAFHFTILEKFFDPVVENSRLMVRLLESEIGSEKFDLVPFIAECSLHNICETAMGVKMSENNEVKSRYLQNVQIFLDSVYSRTMNPLLYLNVLFKLSPNYKKIRRATEEMHEVAMKVIKRRIDERKHSNQTNKDSIMQQKSSVYSRRKEFLDTLLDISESSDTPLTFEEIRNEVDTFLFAGHDTVSIALSMAFYSVGLYPEVQEKVHTEIDRVLGSADAPTSSKMLQELTYLECVLKESLRLNPVVPLILRVTSEDVNIGGYTVPSGTNVGVLFNAVHRSPEYYHNPDQFDPSHFYPENSRNRHPFAYLPFSGGLRNCIGQKFAMMEAKTVLAVFFKQYRIESLTKWDDLIMEPDILMRPRDGIWVRLYRRNQFMQS